MQTQHDIFTEQISLWLDNELSRPEILELQRHLQQCPLCQQTYQAMKEVDTVFRQAAVTMAKPSAGFTARFEKRLTRHRASRRHLWLGIIILLLGTLFFAGISAVAGGVTLISAGSSLLDISIVYYGIALLGSTVSEVRLFATLAELALKLAILVMSQPLFWAYVAVAMGLAALWVRLVQTAYRRTAVAVQMVL